MLLSVLFVRYRDVQPIWDVVSQALFYASPVLYVTTMVPEEFQRAYLANPIASVLTEMRPRSIDPSARHVWEAIGDPVRLLVPVGLVVLAFALGWWVVQARGAADRRAPLTGAPPACEPRRGRTTSRPPTAESPPLHDVDGSGRVADRRTSSAQPVTQTRCYERLTAGRRRGRRRRASTDELPRPVGRSTPPRSSARARAVLRRLGRDPGRARAHRLSFAADPPEHVHAMARGRSRPAATTTPPTS